MLEHHIRPLYQHIFVEPVAGRLARYFSPNAITLLSLATGVASAPVIAYGFPWLACSLLLISGYLDTLDGTVARLTGRATPFGAMLDVISDRWVEWAVILGLYAVDPATRGWPCLLMLGSVLIIITGFLSAGIFIKNDSHKSFNYTPGLMERPEAFTFFALMIFFPAAFTWLAWLFTLLVVYTAYVRVLQAGRILQSPDKEQVF
ncbi:MAG: CDP-alcohol phosphatidyltransferase family protein [Pseudomonadota bacterium]|nr:CDP-alcohol phosphatidyltransferase family protein [Pseudomonadota bacterium]